MHITQKQQIQGYIKAKPDTGYASFYPTSENSLEGLNKSLTFSSMIFARQSLLVLQHLQQLPPEDRISPLLAALELTELKVSDLLLETPDTNEGKQLSSFCSKFKTPLRKALEQNHYFDHNSPWRLHLFFLNSSDVYMGVSHINNGSPYPMGIMRLRMPKSAPSRSTLKLEEAFKTMLSEDEQQRYLCNGMTAVDLGACPGGWTWQLVNRNIRVEAIDNGPMDQALMDTGMVKHLREDGFTYLPEKPVDWLVCDMVERPMHVTRLICRWLVHGHCKHSAFNLKLPMKKRYDMVMECREYILDELSQLTPKYKVSIRQLYHDREEVTLLILQL